MFTGIIEQLAVVAAISTEGTNITYTIQSDITPELKVDQSVAHNGVCLTVTSIHHNTYTVTAVAETLAKTTLAEWTTGDLINLERAMKVGDRLDGHFVQGHVDATGTCTVREELDGSWLYKFSFPPAFAALIIEKGSICINGVSLTAFAVGKDEFTVTIIPYTYTHTNFHRLQPGMRVNLEFDVLGKYLLRKQEVGG